MHLAQVFHAQWRCCSSVWCSYDLWCHSATGSALYGQAPQFVNFTITQFYFRGEKLDLLSWMFGLFSQLRACNVSVAHRANLLTQVFKFVSSKAVRRGPGRPKLMCESISKLTCLFFVPNKVRLPTLCGHKNWQTYPPPFMYF